MKFVAFALCELEPWYRWCRVIKRLFIIELLPTWGRVKSGKLLVLFVTSPFVDWDEVAGFAWLVLIDFLAIAGSVGFLCSYCCGGSSEFLWFRKLWLSSNLMQTSVSAGSPVVEERFVLIGTLPRRVLRPSMLGPWVRSLAEWSILRNSCLQAPECYLHPIGGFKGCLHGVVFEKSKAQNYC